jgi:hypothetical protein
MGYRNYLGSLPKREYNKIKRMTLQELYAFKNEEWSDDPYDKPGHVGVYDVAYNTHYELGKYVDQFPKKFFKTVFKNKETQKHFTEEHDFYVVEKEFVEELIKYYTEKIRTYYKDMLQPFFEGAESKAGFMKTEDTPMTKEEISGVYKLIDHVRSMAMDWGVCGWFEDQVPYNITNPDKDFISSWKYEYSIFNLVILYHTFDWKKNVMIYYGY